MASVSSPQTLLPPHTSNKSDLVLITTTLSSHSQHLAFFLFITTSLHSPSFTPYFHHLHSPSFDSAHRKSSSLHHIFITAISWLHSICHHTHTEHHTFYHQTSPFATEIDHNLFNSTIFPSPHSLPLHHTQNNTVL